MIDNGGLMPLRPGARVRIADGKLSVIDGPFVEAKEVIGGYAIFELRDKDEALAMAKEFMQLHLDHMPGWEGTCELRAFATPGVDMACEVEASSRARLMRRRRDPVGGDDGRRHPSPPSSPPGASSSRG